MDRQKRWQFFLILAVVVLTLVNILPTLFYYSKPLKSPIDSERAHDVSTGIIERVEELKQDSIDWLGSFAQLLKVTPRSIEPLQDSPKYIAVEFEKEYEAQRFKRFLPRAGALRPFVPSQLKLASFGNDDPKKVIVERMIAVDLTQKDSLELFDFSEKFSDQGYPTQMWKNLVFERAKHLATAFAGPSTHGLQVQRLFSSLDNEEKQQMALGLSRDIIDAQAALGSNSSSQILKRYFSALSQFDHKEDLNVAVQLAKEIKTANEAIQGRLKAEKEAGFDRLDGSQRERVALLESQSKSLQKALAIVEGRSADFNGKVEPLNEKDALVLLEKSFKTYDPSIKSQRIDLKNGNPFIKSLRIAWGEGLIYLEFYDDVLAIRQSEPTSEQGAFLKSRLNQFVVDSIATASQESQESISPKGDGFAIALSNLTDSSSFLAFNLGGVAEKRTHHIEQLLRSSWNPSHSDLKSSIFPIYDWKTYQKLPTKDQRLGLVVYAPSVTKSEAPRGFSNDSIYIIARGLDDVLRKYRDLPESNERDVLMADFKALNDLLTQEGFIAYQGSILGVDDDFSKDIIFRQPKYYDNLVKATREDFVVKGDKRFAILDFTDVEQRILTTNRIEDRIQEDLLKTRDEYSSAQVSMNPLNRLTFPKPTKSPFWENLKLSFEKFYRGDDRKILKWGLDLSGGKTVRIALRDQNNRPVTNPEDLNQAVNELYTRINKMGVAERSIRIEGDTIILDFPGSQGLSASELVKASSMTFNIVNMKFSANNPELAESVNAFLQGVWNEAVVTNRKDAAAINEIAWKHLGGVNENGEQTYPRSEHAKTLYENGLRLTSPDNSEVSSSFNDTLSRISVLRGEDFSQWHGQTHPLMVIFNNFALEGSSLDNIIASYEPSKGNILNFSVKGSYEKGGGSPRDDFYAWTSQFSKEKIEGTLKENYSGGRGWPMAVILNETIISMPSLEAPLRDGGMISGSFSQREVNQLAADLKAGSLTYTPKIISEHNVSPELGKEERQKGIMAALVGLLAVFAIMIGNYRFAGVVACCALLFNLLIMWGVLQNLGAALTLPGIAGIVLTIGMAVDANVLVFERIREEFEVSGRIASAIQAGYQKAFSAILDSNLTTILAALILIQFDAGPVKGFAVVLIVGIVSSMFTALFVTRYYFAGWVQNPKHTELHMNHWLGDTKYDFLAQTRKAVIITFIAIAIGTGLLLDQSNTILGMDFTGGYSLQVNLEEEPGITNYRLRAQEALVSAGANARDIQVQQLSRPNQLRIQLGVGMEESVGPFAGMPERLENGRFEYAYQGIPRIDWVVKALEKGGLKIQPAQMKSMESNWTVMSGQFSGKMRNQALMALSLALFAILIYITFRFEFKFAIAAVIALAHDVVLTLGILALFHWLGFPVQINLETIGAIMTIIGYSLNDTIIVFDRIREDIRLLRKLKFNEIINHALNITLSRTLMTSGTTLAVLFALVLLGGPSIFGFAFVMLVGVLVGTLSSLFIAPPVMLYFHDREERSRAEHMKLAKNH